MEELEKMKQEICMELYGILEEYIDEKTKRLLVAAFATLYGYGGQKVMHSITGISTSTIKYGIDQLIGKAPLVDTGIRAKGGGRNCIEDAYPNIGDCLEEIIKESTNDDLTTPLFYTCKQISQLVDELLNKEVNVCDKTLIRFLNDNDYIVKYFVKGLDIMEHDRQFQHIINSICSFQEKGYPVISINIKKPVYISGKDTEKKNTLNDKYDSFHYVIDCIRSWCNREDGSMGKEVLIIIEKGVCQIKHELMLKEELQRFCNEYRMPVSVSYFPNGVAKWKNVKNQLRTIIESKLVEERLIYEVVINIIAPATQKTLENESAYVVSSTTDYDNKAHKRVFNYRLIPSN